MKERVILLLCIAFVLYQLAYSQNPATHAQPVMPRSLQLNAYKQEDVKEANDILSEGWVKQQSVTNIMHDIGFANATTGYMAGEWGSVYKSTDGGTHWASVMDLGDQYYWYGLHVFSTDKVVVGGFTYKNNSKGYSVIRWSTNAGTSWTDDIVVDTTSGNWIFGLDFVDADNGLATGSSGQVYRTTNGGMNPVDWTRIIADTAKGPFYGNFTMHTDGKYFISGSSFCKSVDYGSSWSRNHSANTNYDFGITFPDDLHGWTGGGDDLFGSSGWVHRTVDGGATWSSSIFNPPYPVRNIYFMDTLKGYALGGNKYLTDVTGGIWATKDGGDTWVNELDTDTDNIDMETLAWLPIGNSLDMWAVGASQENGYHSTVYKKSQLITAVGNEANTISLQCYPNPIIGNTTIAYTLPEATTVEIAIYDICGRLVQRVIDNELLMAGKHFAKFDANALPGGTYFYRIKTAYITSSGKMVALEK